MDDESAEITEADGAGHASSRLSFLRLRHLELIRLIAQGGSLQYAAARLNVTAQATGLMLNDIEAALGASLFERSKRGVTVSPLGRAVANRASKILNELVALEQEASGGAGQLGRLRIGALSHSIIGLVPRLLRTATYRRVNMQMRFEDGPMPELLAAMRDGRLDCAIGSITADALEGAGNKDLLFERLFEERMFIVAGRASPLYGQASVTFADLLNQKWITTASGSRTRRAYDSLFLRNGRPPLEPAVECPSLVYATDIAADSALLTLSSESIARRYMQSEALRVLPFTGDFPPVVVMLIHGKTGANHDGLRALRAALHEALALDSPADPNLRQAS